MDDSVTCPNCAGDGYVERESYGGRPGQIDWQTQTCFQCDGKGEIPVAYAHELIKLKYTRDTLDAIERIASGDKGE